VILRKRSRWLNSTVLGIGLASFFSDLSHETVTSLLPGLLATLGVAAAALGTIEGVADGFSSVAKLYGGWWTDRLHRRKPLCAGGYGVMAAATLVIATASHWTIVLSGRALAWIARGLRTPPRKALLAEAVEPSYYGRAFGLERMMDTLGAVMAPAATLVLLRAGYAPRELIFWATIPAILAVLAIGLLVRETPAREPHQHPLFESYRQLPGRVRTTAAMDRFIRSRRLRPLPDDPVRNRQPDAKRRSAGSRRDGCRSLRASQRLLRRKYVPGWVSR
jgi:MFS family permease